MARIFSRSPEDAAVAAPSGCPGEPPPGAEAPVLQNHVVSLQEVSPHRIHTSEPPLC
jgi:hypothetical protein